MLDQALMNHTPFAVYLLLLSACQEHCCRFSLMFNMFAADPAHVVVGLQQAHAFLVSSSVWHGACRGRRAALVRSMQACFRMASAWKRSQSMTNQAALVMWFLLQCFGCVSRWSIVLVFLQLSLRSKSEDS
jgi:hypothetical protein